MVDVPSTKDIELPATRLPGDKRSAQTKAVGSSHTVTLPTSAPNFGRRTINEGRLMAWIATIGGPADAGQLVTPYQKVNAKLVALGVRPNKFAVTSLPQGVLPPSFNGDDLNVWIECAGTADVPLLQKASAAMRLRIRHADWLKRKGK